MFHLRLDLVTKDGQVSSVSPSDRVHAAPAVWLERELTSCRQCTPERTTLRSPFHDILRDSSEHCLWFLKYYLRCAVFNSASNHCRGEVSHSCHGLRNWQNGTFATSRCTQTVPPCLLLLLNIAAMDVLPDLEGKLRLSLNDSFCLDNQVSRLLFLRSNERWSSC